ncbi:DNA-binding protein SMUBP-2 [Coemansia spiralis]|nr:DNA-binding protein SMUBP-2 [Coemansia spiralis]
MFERVKSLHGGRVCQLLQTQYRMNAEIAEPSSANLYGGQLVPDISVAYHVLGDLPHVRPTPDTTKPLVLLDTSRAGMNEACAILDLGSLADCRRFAEVARSMLNTGKAEAVVAHIVRLIAAGVHGKDIGVIAPYRAQIRLLRQLCRGYPAVEVHTVDGFQGGEKEAIILSLVRSNADQKIGFLRDYRRINVAITRARPHLCVVGDCSTVGGAGAFVGAFVAHARESGAVCPV